MISKDSLCVHKGSLSDAWEPKMEPEQHMNEIEKKTKAWVWDKNTGNQKVIFSVVATMILIMNYPHLRDVPGLFMPLEWIEDTLPSDVGAAPPLQWAKRLKALFEATLLVFSLFSGMPSVR